MYIGLAALLLAGIVAALMGDHWGAGWLWASIGVLVAVIGVMYSVAAPFYQGIRQAVGPDGAVAPDDLDSVGGIGFVAVVWLMFAKPF
jgi:hypothetical protein